MTSASIVSGLADLAEAAYINFGQVAVEGLSDVELKTALAAKPEDWPESRRNAFAETWRVVAHQPNTASGFSATVFERINPQPGESRYVFAVRGTEALNLGDVRADLSHLAIDGLAWEQIIDMYNWWQELTTPTGAIYLRASVVPIDPAEAGQPGTVDTFNQDWRIVRTPTTQSAQPPLGQGLAVDVTGHSLGGHLATAFSRLFESSTANVVTINGAGYSGSDANGNINRVFAALGGQSAFPSARIVNVYGDRGPELVTQDFSLVQKGEHRLARLEDWSFGNSLGHGSGQMALSLALYDTLRQLEESDAASMATATMLLRFDSLLRSGANDQYQDYEGLIDGLRRIVMADATKTAVGDSGSFHSRLLGLQQSLNFRALMGHLQVHDSARMNLRTLARSDFGALASLIALSPVMLQASDAAGQAALDSIWQGAGWNEAHQQWLADKSLSPSEREAGKETFTDQWLKDRGAMVGAIVAKNLRDEPYPTTTYRDGLQSVSSYIDAATGIILNSADPTLNPPAVQIYFGSNGADTRSGGKRADRLYGGNGNDSLSGGDNDDRLEGQAGNDTLNGNAHDDVLYGGIGDDLLEGGTDNDLLLGGSGTDTYAFTFDWGTDVIEDPDQQGTVMVDGAALNSSNTEKTSDTTWESADKTVRYALVERRDSSGAMRKDLVIEFTGPTKKSIVIRDWTDGKLGINLSGVLRQPTTNTVINGDYIKRIKPDDPTKYKFFGINYEAAGISPGEPDLLTGNGAANDHILGYAGDDVLIGDTYYEPTTGQLVGGDDVLEGGEGNDVLQGGLGADVLIGGSGIDIIYGSSMGSVWYPDVVAFPPAATELPYVLGAGFNWLMSSDARDAEGFWAPSLSVRIQRDRQVGDEGNFIDGGSGEDFIHAGTGDDTVLGGDDKDEIRGMGGGDFLYGQGAGDRIYGDGGFDSELTDYTPPEEHGNDVLDGGAGDDKLIGQGRDDLIAGSDGNDSIWGDDGNSERTPTAVHGDDFVDAGEGADQVVGGGGADAIYGGAGNDVLLGDDDQSNVEVVLHGQDHIEGEAGDDQIFGGGDDDVLRGGSGVDMIWGDDVAASVDPSAHGSDDIEGGDDNDTVYGGGSDDLIDGGAGDDVLFGDSSGLSLPSNVQGDDYVDGAEGNDFVAGGGGSDALFGGLGNDTLYGEDANAIAAALFNGDDWLDGGAGDDALYGNAGNDALAGGAGSDTLVGGSGNDTYWIGVGDGSDRIDNSASDSAVAVDVLRIETHAAAAAVSRFGDDLFVRLSSTDLTWVPGGFAGNAIDQLIFADGTTWAQADISANLVAGTGTAGNDQLGGTAGIDTIRAGAGDDQIEGGAGADQLYGEAGSDTYRFGLGAGVDTIDERGTPASDENWIVLEPGLRPQDVSLSDLAFFDQPDLVVSLLGTDGVSTGDQIYVKGFFEQPNANSSIDGIRFADGTQWTAESIHQNFYGEPGSHSGNTFGGMYTNDTLNGLAGDETLYGLAGDDLILGNAGNDRLFGGHGNDTIGGGAGNDSLSGGAGSDVYLFGPGGGADEITAPSQAPGEADTIRLASGVAPDQIEVLHPTVGGMPELDKIMLRIAGASDSITWSGWRQTQAPSLRVEFADGTVWSAADVAAQLVGVGTIADEVIYGSAFNDVIQGKRGFDILVGGLGSDTYVFSLGDGSDQIVESADGGVNTVRFAAGVLPDDVVIGQFGSSVDIAYGPYSGAIHASFSPNGAGTPISRLEFADGTVWSSADLAAKAGTGSRWNNSISGDAANNAIRGFAGHDNLQGGFGDDTLDGGTGADQLSGGEGNDTYLYRAGEGADFIRNDDASPLGIDVLRFDGSIAQTDVRVMRTPTDLVIGLPGADNSVRFSNWFGDDSQTIDRVEFADGSFWDPAELLSRIGAPTDLRDWLTGSDSADAIQGLGGDDELHGLGGDDTLLGGAENDLILGGAGSDQLAGDSGDDFLVGDDGSDTLAGGIGNDFSDGGAGVDTYLFNPGFGQDVVYDTTESDGSVNTLLIHGVGSGELLVSRSDYDLYLLAGVDRIALTEWYTAPETRAFRVQLDDGTSWDPAALEARVDGARVSAGDDVLYGSTGNDVIAGLAGNDILAGGQGVDVLRGGDGSDTLSGSYGSALLDGGNGADYLNAGETGSSFFTGGADNDHLTLWSAVNRIIAFNLGDGTDEVDLTGSVGAQVVLSIGGGATMSDVWFGRTPGDSALVIGVGASDSIRLTHYSSFEMPALVLQLVTGGETQTIDLSAAIAEYSELSEFDPNAAHWSAQTALLAHQTGSMAAQAYGGRLAYQYGLTGSFAAVPEFEAQWLLSQSGFASSPAGTQATGIVGSGAADSLAGTAVADLLQGLGGNDTLNGGGGEDWLAGGAGNDTFIVDSTGDLLFESVAEGTDLVQASISWTLAANVENLTLTGTSGLSGTGNPLDNVLTGNSGANALTGGSGNDTYVVGAGDTVNELVNEGVDTVQSSITWTLASNVENLTLTGSSGLSATGNAVANVLTGNSGANTLTGAAGNDRLNGGSGNDTMIGGTGDDAYVVNVSTDVVTELAGEGTDTIESSVTLTLGSGNTVENLTLTGSGATNGTGNGLNNVLAGNSANNTLTGNAGNDTLNGGAGTDTMRGGTGDDTYVVERSADSITENANEGIDTVLSSLVWTLGSNLENLTLTGSSAFNGTGNTLANLLTGNSGANTLQGLAGNDTYDGGAGNDILTDNSTTSNEVYRWGTGSGVDTISDAGGNDRVELGAGIAAGQVVFTRVGNNLELTVSGNSGDKLIVSNWYVGAANRIEDFRLSDGGSVPPGQIPAMLVQRQSLPRRETAAPVGLAQQAQLLASMMAAFDTGGADAGIERQKILPMPRSDAMWVSPAVM